jgi:hypothetical protein
MTNRNRTQGVAIVKENCFETQLRRVYKESPVQRIVINIERLHQTINKLDNTQNVSVTKIVDSSSIQCAESKYGLRIQFLALVVMIHEGWLKA